ncbi:MAG: F0F1 ATP synthase subunit gamma, partial [Planctomycetia bacterium]
RGIEVSKSYQKFEDKPSFDQVEELANRYLKLYLDGEIDRIDVVYTRFLTLARQTAVSVALLPMAAEIETVKASAEKAAGAKPGVAVDYELLPSADDILNELIPVSFKVRLFKAFLDAAVSEQIARRVAMKSATDAAGKLIKKLTRRYNRARQSQITSELAEIIGTAEALK